MSQAWIHTHTHTQVGGKAVAVYDYKFVMRRLDRGGKVDTQDEGAQGASQASVQEEEAQEETEAEEEDLKERARESQWRDLKVYD